MRLQLPAARPQRTAFHQQARLQIGSSASTAWRICRRKITCGGMNCATTNAPTTSCCASATNCISSASTPPDRKLGINSMEDLQAQNYLRRNELRDYQCAYNFLLRVRNELHFISKHASRSEARHQQHGGSAGAKLPAAE